MIKQHDLYLLHPYIRVINASTEPNLNFCVFNTKIFSQTSSNRNSCYHKCERGPTTFKVTKNGSDIAVASLGMNINVGKVYDICIVGEPGNISLFAIESPISKTNPEMGHLRICNLSKHLEHCDIYANKICFAADFCFLDTSEYIAMTPNEYNFDINQKISIGKFDIKPGKYNTLFIINSKHGYETAIFTVDAGSYSGFYL